MALRRVLIVGGVAGGASCAARLRRLDEAVQIHLFDRGPHVSFANCGLPYFVGDVIADEKKLLLATGDLFRQRFNIAVHTRHDVLSIDRVKQILRVKNLDSGEVREEPYDALVLSPGAAPLRPPLPGIDLPGIFAVRTIPDGVKIRSWITDHKPKRALIVGAGFIGLEMAENLVHRGLEVSVLEKLPQVLPPLDPEMAEHVRDNLKSKVNLVLGDGISAFEPSTQHSEGLVALTESGQRLETDLVILSIGVRPEVSLAREAGLPIGPRGGIVVDRTMRTSDEKIWAVGDAVELHDFVTGQEAVYPLAGPANRQGRIVADALCGKPSTFRGAQATAIVSVFDTTIAMTGASEKGLKRLGINTYQKVWLHPGHHAGYFPGAKPIHLKVLFDNLSGRILGAQAVGQEGVDKRIDVIATMIQMGGSVRDLAESELCYAPQFGAAKDPVNIAGMIATNYLDGQMPLANWEKLSDYLVVDVREPSEYAGGSIPGSINVPLSQMRTRFEEIPREKQLAVVCGVGQRAYNATQFLRHNGFQVGNLSGGMLTYKTMLGAGVIRSPSN